MICKAKGIVLKAVMLMLLAPLAVFAGSYDAEQSDPIEVTVDQINGANEFGMEFFVSFHGEPSEQQIFFERARDVGDEEPDIFVEAERDAGGLRVLAHVEPFTTDDEPLELFLGPEAINTEGFNWVFVGFDGNEFFIEWSDGTSVIRSPKQANGSLHPSPARSSLVMAGRNRPIP